MSAPGQVGAGRPTRTRAMVVIAVGTAAVAGWGLAGRLASRPARPAPAPVTAVQDGLAVTADSSWSRLQPGPALPGLAGARTIAFAPHRGCDAIVAAALLPVSSASLLPPPLAARAGQPARADLGGAPAWRYSGLRAGRWRMDVLAAPTTRGVLTVACAAPEAGGRVPVGCLDGLRDTTVAGARRLAPDAGLALRLRLPKVMAPLDAARRRGRATLGAARTPAAQAAAADGLRRANAAAAGALAPLAAPGSSGAALVDALRATANGYAGLTLAARHRDPAAWRRARAAVQRAEATLSGRLAATS